MGVPVAIVLIVIGAGLLWVAADQFVVGAVRLAEIAKVPLVVVGAVVVGFGTSAPELVVSGLAASQGSLDIAVGNITGSNIANLTLVLGVVVIIRVIDVQPGIATREAPISTAAVLLFGAFVVGGSLNRIEGVILVIALGAALLWIMSKSRRLEAGESLEEFASTGDRPLAREILRTVLGLVGTIIGAQALVSGASEIAHAAHIDEGFIGLTIVAIGTSLPELATGIQAARRGQTALILGNLFGSNIFNSLAVGGLVALVGPGLIQDAKLSGLATYIMVGVAIAVFAMIASSNRVRRWQGAVLVAVYVGSLVALA